MAHESLPTPHYSERPPASSRKFAFTCAALTFLGILGPGVRAQEQSPVYVEDSPAAGEAISRAEDLARVGNRDEASRVLQSLLDRQGALLVPRAEDPDLFVETRTRVNEVLLANRELLETYVRLESPTAQAMLETDDIARAERTRLLTSAGFDAALRIAQLQLENAHFGAAWTTIMELEPHPSRTGRRGADAANLLAMIAGYLADGASDARSRDIWDTVRRWRQEAGVKPPADQAVADRPILSHDVTPYDPVGPVDLTGVLAKPLASVPMGETQPETIQRLATEQRSPNTNENTLVLHAMPTVAGDTVYLNDSETITAFDRFTLTRRWRTSLIGAPLTSIGPSNSPGLEDTSGVAVADPYVIVLTGLSVRGRQARERLLGALDMANGQLAWSTSLADLADPSLEEGLLRGPVEVNEGTILLTVVRSVSRQRLLSVGVLAFDVETGDLKWMRQIGSIGVVPWIMRTEPTELTSVRDGIMYRADRIGVVAAIEVETGRLRWIRRMERDFQQRGPTAEPWEGSRPIFTDDGRLIVLSPDRRRVGIMDADTGRLLDTVPAIRFGQPEYLLRLGDAIIGVESNKITARPIDRLTGDAPASTLDEFAAGGLLGRVVVAGDELMLPFVDGLRMIRVEPEADGRLKGVTHTVALDRPGQTIAAPGQLITVDDSRVHSYLSWDVADRMLRERMDASPRDASAAITYAELAYRADRTDQILSAVDRAITTIERDPLSDTAERNRKRLFASLLDMIEPMTSGRPGAMLDDSMREKVIARMSRVATLPSEQVAYLMAAGRIYETTRRPEQAVERYQEVLSSPVLARTVFQEGGRRMPAESEATRRLRRLVRLEGPGVYAAYEAEASRLLDEARADADPARFDRIARRYPVSQQAPRAWLAAADRYRDRGDVQKEILSLEEGYAAAEDTLRVDDPLYGELAGRLVTALLEKDRLVLAEQRLASIRKAHPTLVLTSAGRPLDPGSLSARIRTKLGELNRRARIGAQLGDTTAIEGWTIMRPIDEAGDARLTDRLVMQNRAGDRSLWALDASGRLIERWTAPPDADLLRLDHRSAFFSSLAEEPRAKRTVSRYDVATGQLLWTTPPFANLFEGPDPFENVAGGAPVVDTPLQPNAPLADLFVVFDAETMVLVERTGRAAAFDIETGRLLWAHERGAAPVQPVHDVAAGNGFITIAGIRYLPADRNAAFDNVIAAYDLRTGVLLFEHVDADTIRWLRITPEGHLLAGLDASMLSLDVFRQLVRWKADRSAVHDTVGAWVMPGRAVYRDTSDTLRLISTDDGAGGEDSPLQVEGRLDSGFTQVRMTPLGARMALATRLGLVLLDNDGAVLGADARHSSGRVLLPAIGEQYAVTLDEFGLPAGADDNFRAYDLNIYDLNSVKLVAPTTTLELGAEPSDLLLLDGKILISAGTVTLVIDAPASP